MSLSEFNSSFAPLIITALLSALLAVCGYVAIDISQTVTEATDKLAVVQTSQTTTAEQLKQVSELVRSLSSNQANIQIDLATRKANAFTAQEGNAVQLHVNNNTAAIAQNTREIARNIKETRDNHARVEERVRKLESRRSGT